MGDSCNMQFLMVLLIAGATISAQRIPQRSVPDWIESGPMIGHVSSFTAKVWVRVAKGVELQARATLGGSEARVGAVTKLGDRIRLVEFDDLRSDTDLLIQLYQAKMPTRGVAVSIRTAIAPLTFGRLRIGFGSCLNDVLYNKFPVFLGVAKEQPDMFLFVGDNTYYVRTWKGPDGKRKMVTTGPKGEWSTQKQMFARQMSTRNNPWMQPLLGSVPCYAVWDDHDYGPNNADRLFANKKKSLKVFKQMWANPSYGVKGTKGCFSTFRRGPVQVFLMDCRYHKYVKTRAHPKVSDKDCQIWGEEQLDWLCGHLEASDAPIKLIANGTQFLYQGKTGEGHYQEARREYQTLLDYLHKQRIGGVVFLTGDRHHTELMHVKRTDGPEVIDFTSSPLGQNQTVGVYGGERQPTAVWTMGGDSFGLVTVDVTKEGTGTITFEARDTNNGIAVVNGLPCKTTWKLADLQYSKAGK